jgi:bifunctional non-homologous end joining protein LigD
VHEIKHDGYRAQAHLRAGKSSVFTRNGYDWTPRFKQIADAFESLRGHDLVLEGLETASSLVDTLIATRNPSHGRCIRYC